MRDSLAPGTMLANRYEIGERLGIGGFGATYHACDRAKFRTPCVVKELLPSRRDNETARRLFEREAKSLFDLAHPQIPTLHAYFEENERFFLVQDYVEGETLKSLLARETKLPESRVQDIILQLLDILSYLHEREPPLIHRDIKPANIILGVDGLVHLIDFGAVREVVGADDQQTAIGTAGYTPREQAMGRPRPSSDLYALGATALEMVSGEHPLEWHDRNTGELQWKGRLDCTPSFERFLDGTLVSLSDRFPSARSARDAIVNTPVSVGAPAASAHEPDAAPSAQKSDAPVQTTRRVGLASAIAVLAIAATAWWAVNQRAASTPPASTERTDTPSQPRVDSTLPRDSRRVTADTLTAQEPKRASGGESKKNSTPKPPVARESATPKNDDAVQVDCARLLERVSLGEALSDSDMSRLRRQCR